MRFSSMSVAAACILILMISIRCCHSFSFSLSIPSVDLPIIPTIAPLSTKYLVYPLNLDNALACYNTWKRKAGGSNDTGLIDDISITIADPIDVGKSIGTILVDMNEKCPFITTKTLAYNLCKLGVVYQNDMKVYASRKVQLHDVIQVMNITTSIIDTLTNSNNNSRDDVTDSSNVDNLVAFANTMIDPRQNPPLHVLYDDSYMSVVFKPSGIHSKPWINTMKSKSLTLQDLLPLFLKAPSNVTAIADVLPFPIVVHRLDARVAGCIVVAKTRSAVASLGNQFINKKVTKVYKAILHGKIPSHMCSSSTGGSSGTSSVVDFMIDEDVDGYSSQTRVQLLQEYNQYSSVLLYPITGRRHQLRKHCQHIGCSIVGDDLYESASPTLSINITKDSSLEAAADVTAPRKKKGGLFLMCKSVTVSHPISNNNITAICDDVPRFSKLIDRSERYHKFHSKSSYVTEESP